MILIGVSGKKGAGKDTLALYIRELYPTHIPVYITGFADELKKEVSKSLGVSVEFIELHKDFFRPLLQWWGDYRKEFSSEQYWIIKMVKYMNSLPNSIDTLAIVKDVRFTNEYDFIKEAGGMLIRVERDDVKKDSHASENQLDGAEFKYVVKNNGTLVELKQRTKELMKELELL